MADELKDISDSASAAWDREAISYDALRESDPIYASCIYQTVRKVPKGTSRCLDAGCGTGLSTMHQSTKCKTVIAVDYSLESLKILKNKGFDNVVAVQANLIALPFKDSVFDACVCANTLQHFKPDGSQEHAISELGRVTTETGVLSISVHHYSKSKQKSGWIKEGKPGQPGIDYIFRFTLDDMRAVIPDAVIRSAGYYGFMRVPFFGRRLQNVLAKMFGRIAALLGYGHMLIAVADKRNTR